MLETLLKSGLLKTAFLTFLTRIPSLRSWLMQFLLTEAYDLIIDPLIKNLIESIRFKKDVERNKKLLEKLDEARKNKDEKTYNDTIDDIFS